MPERPDLRVDLTTEQEEKLRTMAAEQREPGRVHIPKRAKLILAIAGGKSLTDACKALHFARHDAVRWLDRFQQRGIDGLKDDAHSTTAFDRAEIRQRFEAIEGRAQMLPEDIARELGIGRSTLYKIAGDLMPKRARAGRGILFTQEESRCGGESVSQDREHMKRIGARGGKASVSRREEGAQ